MSVNTFSPAVYQPSPRMVTALGVQLWGCHDTHYPPPWWGGGGTGEGGKISRESEIVYFLSFKGTASRCKSKFSVNKDCHIVWDLKIFVKNNYADYCSVAFLDEQVIRKGSTAHILKHLVCCATRPVSQYRIQDLLTVCACILNFWPPPQIQIQRVKNKEDEFSNIFSTNLFQM